MEDVLEVYERPYDALRPVVCLDEAAKQILGEVREPLPMKPACASGSDATPGSSVERYDNEYERHGTCALFMLFEPLAFWREVAVRPQRTGADYAQVVRYLCDEKYPEAERIVLVQDNLNTHGSWSLYEAFEPHEAQRLAQRLAQRIEWHYTPLPKGHPRLLAQHGRDRVERAGIERAGTAMPQRAHENADEY
jgi:DDE superfamily endonuclease